MWTELYNTPAFVRERNVEESWEKMDNDFNKYILVNQFEAELTNSEEQLKYAGEQEMECY